MARIIVTWFLASILLLGYVLSAIAESEPESELTIEQLEQMDLTLPNDELADTPFDGGFAMLDELPTKNQLPFFDNRFRIDAEVDEITLLMFRRRGSPAVVLVRPDGSKINVRTAAEHGVEWHDTNTYDLIHIPNPMPGPWQALGRILPESRVMVLSDIELDVDPLPEHLMSGETLKVTARLQNAGDPINARDFREILTLDVIFISTNNPDYDNFGRGIVQVAQFRDDGRGFDERARDGVFTGEFTLDFAAGEWTPKYLVKTPLYTREAIQPDVLIHPIPIKPDIRIAEHEDADHHIKFTVVDEQVEASSLIIQGGIRYPDGTEDTFSLQEMKSNYHQLVLENRGFGSYVVIASAFGSTLAGREFMLTLPSIDFSVNLQTFQAPELEMLPEELQALEAAESAPEEEFAFPWGWVIFINVTILLVGGSIIWLVMSGRSWRDLLPGKKSKAEKKAEEQKPTKKETEQNKPADAGKKDDLDDILDLSLPDD
ncbi:MAG: TIGR03503 family protein [Alkalimonas sp.]|nr:TIGR03503 family protein [Alkalimonas sp.]